MVKFNPKRPVNSKFNALVTNSALGVMVIATKVLFGHTLENSKRSTLYVHIDPAEGKIPFRQTATDVAYKVIGKMKSEGYTLFIDDSRLPTDREAKDPGTCIVARSVEQAKIAVEKLGCPEHLYLDYSLDVYGDQTIMPFIQWFIEKFGQDVEKVPSNFSHTVISQHETGPMEINRKMAEFYDLAWA